jgi:hypothetical protein
MDMRIYSCAEKVWIFEGCFLVKDVFVRIVNRKLETVHFCGSFSAALYYSAFGGWRQQINFYHELCVCVCVCDGMKPDSHAQQHLIGPLPEYSD